MDPLTGSGPWVSGRLDLAVFDQGTWWLNREGLAFRITTEMSTDYLANVIAFLEEHCGYYYRMTLRRAVLTFLDDLTCVGAPELSAPLVAALRAEDPSAWLEGTPLMSALRAALRDHHRGPDSPAR